MYNIITIIIIIINIIIIIYFHKDSLILVRIIHEKLCFDFK